MLDSHETVGDTASIEGYVREAFSRNLGLISPFEQIELANATVAIPGLGGVGGQHLITLARIGLGGFKIADFDVFEAPNVNRQYGARFNTMGAPKIEVMARDALAVNPSLKLELFPEGVSESNIEQFLDGVDVVVDSIDFFAFEHRRLVFNAARKRGIPVVTAGPIGFSVALLVFGGREGLSFDEYFDITPDLTSAEKTLRFQLGLTPNLAYLGYLDRSRINHEKRYGPSLALACAMCSGVAAAEVVKLVLKRGPQKFAPHYAQFDAYLRTYRHGYIPLGNRNPIQRLKLAIARRTLLRKTSPTPVDNSKHASLLYRLIDAGIQAPSGDNVQPWKFDIRRGEIFVYCDEEADSSFFNAMQAASYISSGAVVENIVVAAEAEGLRATVSYGEHGVAGKIGFTKGSHPNSALYSSIWSRHTNRKMYRRRPVLPTTRTALIDSVSHFHGIKVRVVDDRETIKKLHGIVRRADELRVEMRSLHEHLYSMIRWTDAEVKDRCDGLPLRNLEVGLPGEVFLRATRSWSVMSALNRIGASRFVSYLAAKGMVETSGAIVLTVDGTSRRDLVHGGRAMQRLWLTASSLGLHLQPMSAVTCFANRFVREGDINFQPEHRAPIRGILEDFRVLFQIESLEEEVPLMLFRMGEASPVSVRTVRRPLESFFTKDSEKELDL